MNRHDLALFHEPSQHGNMRFHLKVHEYASDPSRPERVSTHWHEEYELLIILKGQGSALVNSRRFEVRTGDILFIHSGNLHFVSAEPGSPFDFYAVDFGLELISSHGNDDIQQKYIGPQTAGRLLFRDHFHAEEAVCRLLRSSLDDIRALYFAEADGYELLIKARLLHIWYILCQNPATALLPARRNIDSRAALTKDVLQFISGNYAAPLTLRRLARQFHMSEGQFCRFFKSQINMTLIEYLNYYRIGVSCDLLLESDSPVSAIALDCGYSNISYFNRMFRKYMHCTPVEYRKAARDGKNSL